MHALPAALLELADVLLEVGQVGVHVELDLVECLTSRLHLLIHLNRVRGTKCLIIPSFVFPIARRQLIVAEVFQVILFEDDFKVVIATLQWCKIKLAMIFINELCCLLLAFKAIVHFYIFVSRLATRFVCPLFIFLG